MQIVCLQLDSVWEDKAANHAKVRRLLAATPPEPNALVLLPEMFATGFSMNIAKISESATHESETFLAQAAREFGIFLMGGIVTTAPDGRGRNEAVVFAPNGAQIARYHKLHPFSFGGETRCYAAGDCLASFAWSEFQVAPFICYDLRFPEIFRAAVRQGAQLYTVIANWPTARVEHWITLLRARAIENQAYVAGVNRCGNDPSLAYPGRSLIIDPRGDILADGGSEECAISADVDLKSLIDYRNSFPALADMRALDY
jgi:predicted amidohydrolase